MYFKIFFKNPNGGDVIIPIKNQKELNSFIYKTLGDNNIYHDSFSDYSISSIQGGKLYDKEHLIFEDKPYIVVASENTVFIETLINNLKERKYTFFDLTYDTYDVFSYNVNPRFDTIITISPILLKHKGKKISIDNENFLPLLKENCIKKLKHVGINDKTFDLTIRHPEKAKTKMIMVGDVFNICTMVSLYVTGKPKTRLTLYHLGLGGSTGSGFGAVKVFN